jgi:hypothetical protein
MSHYIKSRIRNSYSGSIRPVLQIRIQDPELFDPWMRILDGKTIRIWVKHTVPVHISESIGKTFFGFKYLNSFMRIQSRNLLTLDPGWKTSDPGYGINILESQHGIRQPKINVRFNGILGES